MKSAVRALCMWLGRMAFLFVLLAPGCGAVAIDDAGARQSLVEVGERSLEDGERLENLDRIGEANTAYRRALWAFRYHERLTNEQPFLLDEAVEGVRRTRAP
jgi:hypothetical protein